MAEDFYKTLGVNRDASQADIEKAYRTLARKLHPDLNPDDKTAKKKFQAVQAAFDVLGDQKKRELYDRYGSSFEDVARAGGHPGARPGRRAGPGGPSFGGAGPEGFDFSQIFGGAGGAGGDPSSFADLFSQFTGGGAGARRRRAPASENGGDLESQIEIPFQLAATGGQTQLTLDRGGKHETLEVRIPAGIDTGKKIRLRGQGQAGPGGQGDLLITVHVTPHPWFTRKGDDLYVRVPVTLLEAAEGAKVDVPTPKGTVTLSLPPGSSSGRKLRIKGHGIEAKNKPPGDLYAEVQVMLPGKLDPDSLEALRKIDQQHPTQPRDHLQW